MATRRTFLTSTLLAAAVPLATIPKRRPGQILTTPDVVAYPPHPDDETLTMGPLLASLAAAGHRVLVVGLTDGSATTVGPALGLTPAQVAQARWLEFRDATLDISWRTGVRGTLPDGALTVGEALTVMRGMAVACPGALHVSMSQLDDHPDHLAAAAALTQLGTDGARVQHCVYRPFWGQAGAGAAFVGVSGEDAPTMVADGIAAYRLINIPAGRYGIGYRSVPAQFDALAADPRAMTWTR